MKKPPVPEVVDMDRTYISELERGINQPPLTVILRLAQALDTSHADMVQAVQQSIDEDRPRTNEGAPPTKQ